MATRGRIRVVVRTRPSPAFADHLIKFTADGKSVVVHQRSSGKEEFRYINNQPPEWSFGVDCVLHNSSQEDVYDGAAKDTVKRALDGFNGTIMAYGQTGAGKTFTMTGHTENYRLRGIIPRAISHIFQEIRSRPDFTVSVRISYAEIYNEVMCDLLATFPDPGESPFPLTVVENDKGGVNVKGLTGRQVHSEEEALNLLFEGETNRAIGTHSLNKNSSRSHCVFTVYIESRSRVESGAAYTVSKLNLVDLAGSERLGKTHSEGQTQKEAMYINKSLTFLEQVVIALADKKRDHIPYRQSKLTHMLKDSLGGGCNTVLVANIWGDAGQLEETTSTLRFATRMMCISSEPVQNVLQDPLLLLKQYEQEIKSLRQELAMHNTLANRANVSYEPLSENEIQDIQREVKRYLDGTIQDIELLSVRQIKETFSQFRQVVVAMQEELSERAHSLTVPSQGNMSTSPGPERKQSKVSRASRQVTADNLHGGDVLVGDTDGQGFSLGVAPSVSKSSVSALAATKKMKNKTKGKQRNDEAETDFDVVKETNQPLPTDDKRDSIRPDTPPSREEAFEQFKREKGKEINKVLMENKEMLREKRKEAHDLSLQLNRTKQAIDQAKQRLEQREQSRGHLSTSDGVKVMDQEDFDDITELKKWKSEYRTQYENLNQLKLDVSHCQQFVDRSRQKLVQEFEQWYQLAFLGDTVETSSTSAHAESDGEVFDKLQQELLKDGPDAIGFYNARTRTNMRTTYPSKRRPGNVTSSLLNKPPTLLSLS